MQQTAWTKCFVAALLVFLTAATLAWPPPAATQSKNSRFSQLQPSVTILTPTEGVDFKEYLAKFTPALKRNWYALMPEAALLGEKGIVVVELQIQQDGTLPSTGPTLERSSKSDVLDRAALAAIKVTAPFERLPTAFHGPNIKLRVIFFYNVGTPKGPTNPENSGNKARFLLLHQPQP